MKNPIILMVMSISIIMAEIHLSGDARVRPRYDIKNWGVYPDSVDTDGDDVKDAQLKLQKDTYYLYRARLNVKADIGNGWYFNSKLGTNAVASWTGKFGTGDLPDESSVPSAGRGSVSFLELNFGLNRDNYGFAMGLLPLGGFSNPALDIHFYPEKVIDIPWSIFSNNAFHGFSGYGNIGPGKLNGLLSVDNNVTQSEELLVENVEQEVISKDQYSLILNYDFNALGLSVKPQLLMTVSEDDSAAPMTYGIDVTGPALAGFRTAISYYNTSQKVKGISEYTGNLTRIKVSGKVGPGSLLFWYDSATMKWGRGETHNYTYIWAHYKYVVYKSENGEFSIKPTVRIVTETVDGSKDYKRSKFELTTEMKFK